MIILGIVLRIDDYELVEFDVGSDKNCTHTQKSQPLFLSTTTLVIPTRIKKE